MISADFYKAELAQMRKNYSKRPLRNVWIPRPYWLSYDDPMSEIYFKKAELLQRGKIVYAKVVQANVILFRNFPQSDCPANLLLSLDDELNESPDLLYDVALELFSYKDKPLDQVPEQWREVASSITNERDRKCFNFTVNYIDRQISGRMIANMIFRRFLPRRRLCGGILPVLASPDFNHVIILPKRYWTRSFKEKWIRGEI